MKDWLIIVLFSASLLFFAGLLFKVGFDVFRPLRRRKCETGYDQDRRSFRSKLLTASLLFIGAVWCLRFAVGYYAFFNPNNDINGLHPAEEIFNSLVHTLQTFSLDEKYTEYITVGKNMIGSVFGEESWLIGFYGVYAAVLNFMVPVAGGAILFEVIREFSPKLQLTVANCRRLTDKYYFSELNDNSIALAQSIISYKKRGVCVIFTDAYAGDGDEGGAERIAKARSFGAICIKDDLLHIRLHGRSKKIFLIDRSENDNLQTLAALLEKDDKKIGEAEIYVFSSDDAFSHLDEEVSFLVNKRIKTLRKRYKDLNETKYEKPSEKDEKPSEKDEKSAETEDDYVKKTLPTVIPVNGIRNMAVNLLSDVPLYEPIIDKDADAEGKKSLNVTILGSGVIGTEIFLNSYWCGQMLDCRMKITVVSKEKRNKRSGYKGEGDFEGRINNINPDIMATVKPDSKLLKYNETSYSPPYFSYDYKEYDVLSDDFSTFMSKKGLLDTDYFIVALGSDEDNFAVADRLRRLVGVHHLFKAKHNKTVIAYVIYNTDLARVLNCDNLHKYSPESETPDILMYAFGSLESVYSVKNVFFEGKADAAYDAADAYYGRNLNEEEHSKNKEKRFRDIYTYQADLTKVYHRQYKEYSAGFHKVSVFSAKDVIKECHTGPEEEYLRYIMTEKADKEGKKQRMIHRLAWLEHRRWCAYMRIKGFRAPDKKKYGEYTDYFDSELPEHKEGDHKFVALKLHPCIIECSEEGIDAEFDEYCFEKTETEFKKDNVRDFLDKLSRSRRERDGSKEDFKRWDYPEYEISKKERAEFKRDR